MGRSRASYALSDNEYQRLAFTLSALGHLVFFIAAIYNFGAGWGDFQAPVVYSVTIEGGKNLGGLSQAPDEKKQTMIAPPKNTSQKETKAQEQKKAETTKAEKAKIPQADKGEVQIKPETKKKETKPQEKAQPKQDDKKKVNDNYQDVMQRYLGESAAAGGTGFGAAALGGKGMGGGTLISPEHLAYLNKIREYVRSGFFWNEPNSALKVDITFAVGADGKISDPRITASSGNRLYDDAALRAVLKANPLPAPGQSFIGRLNPVTINLTPQDL